LGAAASGISRDAAFVPHVGRKAVPPFGCHRTPNRSPTAFLSLNFNTKKSHPGAGCVSHAGCRDAPVGVYWMA